MNERCRILIYEFAAVVIKAMQSTIAVVYISLLNAREIISLKSD